MNGVEIYEWLAVLAGFPVIYWACWGQPKPVPKMHTFAHLEVYDDTGVL